MLDQKCRQFHHVRHSREQSPREKGFILCAYTAVTACAENRNNARNLSHQQANLLVIEGNPVTPVEEQMHKLVVKSGF